MAANKGPRNATPIKANRQKPERVRRVAGAHSARTSLQDRFRSWRQHHQDSFRDALQRLNAARASSAMTILVIAIALALPAGLAVLLDNARAITRGWDGNAHLSVFLDMNISEQRQRQLPGTGRASTTLPAPRSSPGNRRWQNSRPCPASARCWKPCRTTRCHR